MVLKLKAPLAMIARPGNRRSWIGPISISILALDLVSRGSTFSLSSSRRPVPALVQGPAAAKSEQVLMQISTMKNGSGIWDAGKPIPVDPVMDFDFTRDDDNPLESIYERPFNVSEDEERIAKQKAFNLTDEEIPPPKKNASSAEHRHDSELEQLEREEKEETKEEEVGVSATDCATRQDSRASSWFGETAPTGTPCLFGVDPRDEGQHCVQDSEQKYGSFGWCYTNEGKTQWGSCNEHCPLFGHAKILGNKLSRTQESLDMVKKLLNQSLVSENATSKMGPTGLAAAPAISPHDPRRALAAAPSAAAAMAAAPAAAPAAAAGAASAVSPKTSGKSIVATPGAASASALLSLPAAQRFSGFTAQEPKRNSASASASTKKMTPAEFMKARGKVLEWLTKHRPIERSAGSGNAAAAHQNP